MQAFVYTLAEETLNVINLCSPVIRQGSIFTQDFYLYCVSSYDNSFILWGFFLNKGQTLCGEVHNELQGNVKTSYYLIFNKWV